MKDCTRKRFGIVAVLLVCSFTVVAQNVGIGTALPVEKLHVAGNVKADTVKVAAFRLTANAGAGKVLVSDEAGNGSWQTFNGGGSSSGDETSFDFYVSSVNGNDNNSGFSIATPKKTLAAVTALLSSGKSLGIEKGSYFREMLAIAYPNVVVSTYGSGSKPVMDATDIISQATIAAAPGYGNLYRCSATPITTGGQSFSFFENGQRLKRTVSPAECAQTEGSFFAPAPSSGTAAVIYFHPIGHTNPASDGKKYEVTVRDAGLTASSSATGITVNGIRTRASLQNDGTMVINATGSYIKNCVFEDGSKHTMFVSDGCTVEDCTALKGEGIDSYFVYYYQNGGASLGTTFRRCYAIGGYAYAEEQSKYATAIGFFCHASSGALASVTFEDCYAENLTGGFGGDARTVNIVRCKTHFVAVAASAFASSPQTVVNIRQCFFDQRSSHAYQKAQNDNRPLLQLLTGTNNVEGNVLVVDPSVSGNILYSSQDNTVINFNHNTVVAQSGTAGFTAMLKNGTGLVTVHKNIFYGFERVYYSYNDNSSILADGNVYYRLSGGLGFKNGFSFYSSFSNWQASGQDGFGINIDPGFAGSISTWTNVGNAATTNPAVQSLQAGASYY